MIKEHDRVVLTVPLPSEGLEAGDVGTVVHIHKDGQAYVVEFLTLDGNTAAVATWKHLKCGRSVNAILRTRASLRSPEGTHCRSESE